MRIVPFENRYAAYFYSLNKEWLERFFYVEPYDEQVLSDPQRFIIAKGGHIFFTLDGDSVIGTVALIPHDTDSFELTKMAVHTERRGQNIGQNLVQHCIEFAKLKEKNLMLYSHTKLENAIHIYRKFRFQEVPLEKNNPYKRSNIKMILTIKP